MLASDFLGIRDASNPFIIGVIAIVAVFILLVAALALHYWQNAKIREAERDRIEIEADLKAKMIDRGMSADEIASILSATPSRAPLGESPRGGKYW